MWHALEKIQFKGITGDLIFDATHNPPKQMIEMQVKWRGAVLSVSLRPDPDEVQSDAESPKKDWSPSSLT
jgi:hypothetical protein